MANNNNTVYDLSMALRYSLTVIQSVSSYIAIMYIAFVIFNYFLEQLFMCADPMLATVLSMLNHMANQL